MAKLTKKSLAARKKKCLFLDFPKVGWTISIG